MKNIKQRLKKIMNSSTYGCLGNSFKVFNLYQQLTQSILLQFRIRGIDKFNTDVILAQYNSIEKHIILNFRSVRKRYDCIFRIKNSDEYKVTYALLAYMNLLDKVKVISNVRKTKR